MLLRFIFIIVLIPISVIIIITFYYDSYYYEYCEFSLASVYQITQPLLLFFPNKVKINRKKLEHNTNSSLYFNNAKVSPPLLGFRTRYICVVSRDRNGVGSKSCHTQAGSQERVEGEETIP